MARVASCTGVVQHSRPESVRPALSSGCMASQWRLADHGDRLERAFGLLFGEQFPSYEIYWRKYSVPLTKREDAEYSHHFKSDKDLAKLDPPRTKFDLDLATLHYATFWHLCAAYRLRHLDDEPVMELDTFVHCITRLSSARDTAAAFAGIAHRMGPKAKRAREAWFNAKPSKPMQLLGAYRNFLVHGAPFMQLDVNGMYPLYPRIGREARYHNNWRGGYRTRDFAMPPAIVDSAWAWCLRYVELTWRAVLKVAGPPSTYPSPSPEVDWMVELSKGPPESETADGILKASGVGRASWVWKGGADSGVTSRPPAGSTRSSRL